MILSGITIFVDVLYNVFIFLYLQRSTDMQKAVWRDENIYRIRKIVEQVGNLIFKSHSISWYLLLLC